eukprot:COSAG01_NODE_1931_length_8874_cov_108.307236_7_plen_74_part_00
MSISGAGGDSGIAKLWTHREISASFHDDQAQHLIHPHLYYPWQADQYRKRFVENMDRWASCVCDALMMRRARH